MAVEGVAVDAEARRVVAQVKAREAAGRARVARERAMAVAGMVVEAERARAREVAATVTVDAVKMMEVEEKGSEVMEAPEAALQAATAEVAVVKAVEELERAAAEREEVVVVADDAYVECVCVGCDYEDYAREDCARVECEHAGCDYGDYAREDCVSVGCGYALALALAEARENGSAMEASGDD